MSSWTVNCFDVYDHNEHLTTKFSVRIELEPTWKGRMESTFWRSFPNVTRIAYKLNLSMQGKDKTNVSVKPRTHLHICFGRSNVSHLVWANMSCDKSLSQFVFCDQIPMSLVTRSEWVTKCDGKQNRHVFASVYGICSGIRLIIRDIATSSK